ncbi:MAG TPA: hypothetical protein PLP29_18100 [Candidatus Ozemobacteraceae bacterium]|nr:hypothetical protein [Candidatus Ozemobacteraceae bacterium]
MSGAAAEIFGLLAFSLTVGTLFSRTFFGLVESWFDPALQIGPRRRRN